MKTDNIIIFPTTLKHLAKGPNQLVALSKFKTDHPLSDEVEEMIENPYCFEPLYITRERQRRIDIMVRDNMPRMFLE